MRHAWRYFRNLILVSCLAVPIAMMACSSSGGGFFGGSFPIIDLAVGDDGNFSDVNSQVLLFFNVLFGDGTQAPDVTLDNAGSGIEQPRSMAFFDGDLYVANGGYVSGTSTITIYRDYLSLSDADSADATLSTLATIGRAKEIVVASDQLLSNPKLFVCDDSNDQVLIFNNANTIASDMAPDVTLDSVSTGIDNCDGLTVDGNGDLYVANYNPENVMIFRDVPNLVDGSSADVILDGATSFLGISNGTRGVEVSNNILYVPTEDNQVFVFENASSLVDNALADAILSGASDLENNPIQTLVVNNTLFVAIRDSGTADAGIVGFTGADNLVDAQVPDILLDLTGSGIEHVQSLSSASGALFFQTFNDGGSSATAGDVFIYYNADAIITGSAPDLTLTQAGVRPINVTATTRLTF